MLDGQKLLAEGRLFYPCEYRVLIEVDKTQDKTEGGIYLADQTREREQHQTTEGILIACGGLAFTGPDWGTQRPMVGDKVLFTRYAGESHMMAPGFHNKDKRNIQYRYVNDKDIIGYIESEEREKDNG